jgi:hypothetical protein
LCEHRYSGTATFSRFKPLSTLTAIGLPELDKEGRVLATEFESFWLVNSYVPNSGSTLGRLGERTKSWDPAFGEFCKVVLESGGGSKLLHVIQPSCSPLMNFEHTKFCILFRAWRHEGNLLLSREISTVLTRR